MLFSSAWELAPSAPSVWWHGELSGGVKLGGDDRHGNGLLDIRGSHPLRPKTAVHPPKASSEDNENNHCHCSNPQCIGVFHYKIRTFQ